MATSPDASQLIAMLLQLVIAKQTIKVRVFTGYSLLLTALSIPNDGNVTTQTQGYMTGTKGMGRHKVTNSQSKPSQFKTT